MDLLERDLPDLAIFDIRMEGMSGWELIERLQQTEKCAALPVIAISADDPPEVITPFKAWITRPIEADRLYELVTTCLAASTASQL